MNVFVSRWITECYREFQLRVARRVASSDAESSSASYLPSDEQSTSRNTLGEIRPRGKHGQVPANRVSTGRSAGNMIENRLLFCVGSHYR